MPDWAQSVTGREPAIPRVRAPARHALRKGDPITNADLTLIAALLDRSGSMAGCKRATETGFDEMIAKQRCAPGEANVTL